MRKLIICVGFLMIISPHLTISQSDMANKYDVTEYILDLHISNMSTAIDGNVIMNAKVVAPVLDTVVVDLIDTIIPNQTFMIVDSVFVDGLKSGFQHYDDQVFIMLFSPILKDQTFSTQIYYHGMGATNNNPYNGGIKKYTYSNISHSYSLSQPYWSKVWWPGKQVLGDKADSVTFYITTDSLNKTGSNGVLKSTEFLTNGKVKYKWQTNYPIDYYLISFACGPLSEYNTFAQLPNTQDSVLLQNFLFPNSDYYHDHLNAIDKTKQLLFHFSNLLGTYPFSDEKYGYFIVDMPPYGGMENQTMCTIGYNSMDTTSTHHFGNYGWLLAHELAHQWFGDFVTCEKWNYMWLHEGFSSYLEYIALQDLESQAKADYWISNAHTSVKSLPGGSVYIPDSMASDIYSIFDQRLQYKKGASILHTLRYEINNDSLFFEVLRSYLSTYGYSNATAEDFRQVAESVTGIDFSVFFDQWFYGEGYPLFNISWEQTDDTVTIISSQTTSTAITPFFKTHFDLKLNHTAGDTMLRLFQETNHDIYKIYTPYVINSVHFDPYIWLIAENDIFTKIEHNSSNSLPFKIVPNPVTDYIIIITDENKDYQNYKIKIYDVNGHLMKTNRFTSTRTNIDIRSLKNGLYILKVSGESSNNFVSKFVKQ